MATNAATHVRMQFENLDQQTHAAELGMWVFLASEALFFAGLFALYTGYRVEFGQAFADGVRHTDKGLGTANTFLLLTSSVLVALAGHTVRAGESVRRAVWQLIGAIAIGVVFLALKVLEYWHHFREGLYPGLDYRNTDLRSRAGRAFFNLYYAMTGLHAIHVAVGIVLLAAVAYYTHRRRFDATYHTPLELCGIYWHFVDLVWVFLWPMFYLMKGH